MLAAIGIIIVREIPPLLGAESVAAKSVLVAILALPRQLATAQPVIALLGIASLAFMFLLNLRSSGFWKRLPAAIIVTLFGIAAGFLLDLGPQLRIRMPESFLDALHLPDFAGILARPDLWGALLVVVVTFTSIDGVESVASVKAVDRLDPWRRVSDPNKTLRAMGVCNLCAGMLGGLTIIPNAVPSRANIDAGARTLRSNLFSGLFLLLFTLALPWLLARIPLAAIAGILTYVGWRLCEPALFARMLALGLDRFIVFVGTVVAILMTDLLVGMPIGIAIELVLLVYLLMPSFRWVLTGRLELGTAMGLLARSFAGLFKRPVIKARIEGEGPDRTHVLTLGSLVGFNLLPFEKTVKAIPPREPLTLRFTESARIVDHNRGRVPPASRGGGGDRRPPLRHRGPRELLPLLPAPGGDPHAGHRDRPGRRRARRPRARWPSSRRGSVSPSRARRARPSTAGTSSISAAASSGRTPTS